MPIEKDSLTAEELSDWQHYSRWYEDNWWVGEEARSLAWADLQRKYPRLQEFAEAPQNP